MIALAPLSALLLFQGTPAPPAAGPTIVFSGELRGELVGCNGCGAGPGLAAQAGWLEKQAEEASDPLIVDGGNSLFGGQSQASQGAAAADVLELLGYDVLNIGYRDLRLGLEATRALVDERSFTALSANLLDATTGDPLFTPTLVREVGGARIGLIGLSEIPVALPYSPELRAQLAGVTIAPPEQILAARAAALRAESDAVVLVFYGSNRALARALAGAEGAVDLVLLAGGRAASPRVPTAVADAGSGAIQRVTKSEANWSIERCALGADDASAPSALRDALLPVLAEHGLGQQPDTLVIERTAPRPPPGPPQGLPGVGLDPARVNRAIEEGREALWRLVLEEDGPGAASGGELALAAFARLHATEPERRSELLPEISAIVATMEGCANTYHLSLVLQLAVLVGRPPESVERLTRRLVDNQRADGAWDYSSFEQRVDSEPDGAAAAIAVIARRGPWTFPRGEADSSITQFALLGLRSAERAGFDVADEVWARAEQHFVRDQSPDGGWGYRGSRPRGSMTCAGVASLALCRHALGAADPTAGADIQAGLGWLDAHFSVDDHPGCKRQHTRYYQYSLERVGVLLGDEFIGANEWYPLGARSLIDSQRSDGTWDENGLEPLVATAFALLFLSRATEALEPDPGEEGRLLVRAEVRPPAATYLVLDASGSMLARAPDGRTRFEHLQSAVLGLIEKLPPDRRMGIRVYGSQLRAIEPGADEDSLLLAPLDKHDPARLAELVRGMRARGKTPLAFSLSEAKKDLAREKPPAHVLLLSDGGDDSTARRDPVAAATELRKATGATVDVIGFAIRRGEKQLRAIAAAGGGDYWTASATGEELESRLGAVALAAPGRLEVVDESGAVRAHPAPGEPLALPPGTYRLRAAGGDEPFERTFTVRPGRTTQVVLKL